MSTLRSISLKESILGLLFMMAGVWFVYTIGQAGRLDCTRAESAAPACTLRTTWIGWVPVREVGLAPLRGAELEADCEYSCNYRVLLQTAGGPLPMTRTFTSDSAGKQEVVDQINAFANNPTQQAFSAASGGGWDILLPLIFLGIGLFLLNRSITWAGFNEPGAEKSEF